VPFDIARTIFVHSIWLCPRLAVNLRAASSSAFKMSLDVVNLNVRTAAYARQAPRRNQLKIRSHTMQPNRCIACPNLCMHRNALVVSLDAT
jgi:hypothetical protein